MVRRGRKSIVYEVSNAISAINFIGKSKREARFKNQSGIHSIKQIEETLSASQNFVKWVRGTYRIKTIFNLTEEHYVSYINHLEALGRSAGHRQNVETALKHLQKGMQILSKERQLQAVLFVPQKRVTDWKELKKAENRSYSHRDYEAMIPYLSMSVQQSVKLMRFMGLRVRESCAIKPKQFIPDGKGGFELNITSEEAKGITKGGRYRITPVPKFFEEELFNILSGKDPDKRLLSIETSTVRKGVFDACKKANISQNSRGTHGFRHLYCRDRLNQLLQDYRIFTEGKRLLTRIMSNRDINRKADYGIISDKDIEVYTKLKSCIDKIHEEIGHGKDRWDLAEIYLREDENESGK
jgi:hypothetical protein